MTAPHLTLPPSQITTFNPNQPNTRELLCSLQEHITISPPKPPWQSPLSNCPLPSHRVNYNHPFQLLFPCRAQTIITSPQASTQANPFIQSLHQPNTNSQPNLTKAHQFNHLTTFPPSHPSLSHRTKPQNPPSPTNSNFSHKTIPNPEPVSNSPGHAKNPAPPASQARAT
ncbi:hypothetical protein M0R45_000973 [Rubus argutus]|uniref:Uncharacterized protein n=1 Tax=Rubus argutus TaxID=59490 RepID=A0AAW1VNA8_RUBAR